MNTDNVINMNNEVNDTDNITNTNNEIIDVDQILKKNSIETLIARYKKLGYFKTTNPFISLQPCNHHILDEYKSEYIILQDYMFQFNEHKRKFEIAFVKYQQKGIEITNRSGEIDRKLSLEGSKPEDSDIKLLEINIQETMFDITTIYYTEMLFHIEICEEAHKKCVELLGKITDFSEQAIERSIKRSKLKQLFNDMYCSIVSGFKSHLNNDVADLTTVKVLVEDYIKQVKEQIETNNNYPTKQVFNVFLDKMCDLFGLNV